MQSAKEAASNMAASAKSGMDKTKATMQEKVERMTTHNPMEKDMATQRKNEKIDQAEWNKQATQEHNTASTHQPTTTTTTGLNSASAMHGHGTTTGHQHGLLDEGAFGMNPAAGTATNTAAIDPRVAGAHTQTGYGTSTGGAYS